MKPGRSPALTSGPANHVQEMALSVRALRIQSRMLQPKGVFSCEGSGFGLPWYGGLTNPYRQGNARRPTY
jgi:hypothetical protein